MSTQLRVIWPIVNETVPLRELIREAHADLPMIANLAHAKVTSPGKFQIADAAHTPGSGNSTRKVLIYTAPAVEYHRVLPMVDVKGGRRHGARQFDERKATA